MNCAICTKMECRSGKDCTGLGARVAGRYAGNDLRSMRSSAKIEAEHYMKKTRLEELILYAKEMGYRRLGLAFCVGLSREAKLIHGILQKHFQVSSVCCKVCGIEKSAFRLKRLHKGKGVETTCNPIGQALVLNQKRTELNVIVGLCIGHDAVFTKHSAAPVTTFAVKDRVLAHNPLGAVYSGYDLRRRFGIT